MWNTFRIVAFICTLLCAVALQPDFARAESSFPALKLQCNASFDNYDGIDHAVKTSNITLKTPKHKPGGMQLCTQTKDYEFWVMSHSIQTLQGKQFISNFQVAIRAKNSGLFMHALSDSSHSAAQPPKNARICLVDYANDSNLEKGELCFSCSLAE